MSDVLNAVRVGSNSDVDTFVSNNISTINVLLTDDKKEIFINKKGTKIHITDVIKLNTNADRVALITPIEDKFYYIITDKELYYRNGGVWDIVSGGGSVDMNTLPTF